MAEQTLPIDGTQPVDLEKHPSGIVPTLQYARRLLAMAALWAFITPCPTALAMHAGEGR